MRARLVRYVRDRDGFREAFQSPRGMFGRYMNVKGYQLQRLAMRQVGKKTTKLVRSIQYGVDVYRGDLRVQVGSNNEIALLHHEGSKAHEIRPRRAKVLRFVQSGRIRYAHRVWHPGTRKNRYLTDNLRKVL